MNSFYTGKKVVVTGGAGFIGSHLVEQLVTYGADVTVLDNLVTGKKENLALVINAITLIEGDVKDFQTCQTTLKNCFAIFHLAAQVAVQESFENPQLCYESNVTGTFNLLEAAKQHNVQRFIFSSSCAVYGDRSTPCKETDECSPLSPYAYSKYTGEQLCLQYSKLFKLPTICLRYFNVFGPRQNPYGPYAGVLAKFTHCMKKNQPITIFGDGSQTRDFVPVAHIVNANLRLAELPLKFLTGLPVNIATESSCSLLNLVKKLKEQFPTYNQPFIFEPTRPGDILKSEANCTRFKQLMQFLE